MSTKQDRRAQRVLDGYLETWVDAFALVGRRAEAREVQPDARGALADTDYFGTLVASWPGQADFFSTYAKTPMGKRQKLIGRHIGQYREHASVTEQVYLIALHYKETGRNADETIGQLDGLLHEALEDITLAELEQSLDDFSEVEQDAIRADIWHSFSLRSLLSYFGLKPGSIAGRNSFLWKVVGWRKAAPALGEATQYEMDLKLALWEAAQGKLWAGVRKELAKRGEKAAQAALLARMLQGKEQRLVRTLLLRTLRMEMEHMPDIKRERESLARPPKCPDVPLADHDLHDLVSDLDADRHLDAQERLLASLDNAGVRIEDLSRRDLDLLNSELRRRENDKTRREFYGTAKPKVDQQFKRLKDKLNPGGKDKDK